LLPGSNALCVRFSPDGKRLAWSDRTFTICLYDLEQAREVPFPAPSLRNGAGNLSWYPDSQHLAFVSGDGVAEVWNVGTRERVMRPGRQREFDHPFCALSPNGRWFAASPKATAPTVWDARTGQRLVTLPAESGPVLDYAWAGDDRLALALADGGV